jgi:RimJ/RimL family protein N-acetyltransferase
MGINRFSSRRWSDTLIVTGEHVARWVMEKAGAYTERMTAIGWEVNGVIVAGTAFENYNGNNMFGHQRIDSSPTREYWFQVVNYIFNQCKVKRFTGIVEADNYKAIKLNLKIGLVIETTLKDAGRNGDLLVMTLWPENCKMLNWSR